MSVAVAIVWNERLVGHNIAAELLHCLFQFLFVLRIFLQRLQVVVQIIHSLQSVRDIPCHRFHLTLSRCFSMLANTPGVSGYLSSGLSSVFMPLTSCPMTVKRI